MLFCTMNRIKIDQQTVQCSVNRPIFRIRDVWVKVSDSLSFSLAKLSLSFFLSLLHKLHSRLNPGKVGKWNIEGDAEVYLVDGLPRCSPSVVQRIAKKLYQSSENTLVLNFLRTHYNSTMLRVTFLVILSVALTRKYSDHIFKFFISN